MDSKTNRAIGVFDSGIGGLTVVRSLMERLPFENIIYFGDIARSPYGVKSKETIIKYAIQIVQFLLSKDVKLIITACNTMAAVAFDAIDELTPAPKYLRGYLRHSKVSDIHTDGYHVPVLNVLDTGAKIASLATISKRIGIIGTPSTINSHAYDEAIHRYDHNIHIISQACPLFVPLVEEGWLDHPATKLIAQEYLKPIIAEQIDTLVLGCTHYPLLKPLLQDIMGKSINLVDSADAMADIAADLIDKQKLGNKNKTPPDYLFCVSDVPYRFQTIGERFLGRSLGRVELVSL